MSERKQELQSGVCAICKSTSPSRGFVNSLVDHDPKTGKTRGLLCHDCDAALDLIVEKVGIDAFISYLNGRKRTERG
jgi:Recombination endonuclease VII